MGKDVIGMLPARAQSLLMQAAATPVTQQDPLARIRAIERATDVARGIAASGRTPGHAVNAAGRVIGEDHPNARYSNREVDLVHELHESGMGYRAIAIAMEMPRSTVRDICTGRRRCQTPAGYRKRNEE